MFKTIETKGMLTHRYESLGAFIDHQDSDRQYHVGRNASWSGVSSWQEAVDIARAGLPAEGIRVLKGAEGLTASAVKQALSDTVRSYNDVAGAYVDMGRFMDGTPECMVENMFELAPVINPVVTIVSNVTASCWVDADDMRERGRLVVALIKAAETKGRATELWVDMTSRPRKGETYFRIAVRVKKASQPLDMGAIMYAFTHPSMMRVMCHNAMHSLPKSEYSTYGVGGGYARLEYGKVAVEDSYGPGAVYLPAINHRGENPEETVTRVLRELGLS
jgi:hypothetical protein